MVKLKWWNPPEGRKKDLRAALQVIRENIEYGSGKQVIVNETVFKRQLGVTPWAHRSMHKGYVVTMSQPPHVSQMGVGREPFFSVCSFGTKKNCGGNQVPYE